MILSSRVVAVTRIFKCVNSLCFCFVLLFLMFFFKFFFLSLFVRVFPTQISSCEDLVMISYRKNIYVPREATPNPWYKRSPFFLIFLRLFFLFLFLERSVVFSLDGQKEEMSRALLTTLKEAGKSR